MNAVDQIPEAQVARHLIIAAGVLRSRGIRRSVDKGFKSVFFIMRNLVNKELKRKTISNYSSIYVQEAKMKKS